MITVVKTLLLIVTILSCAMAARAVCFTHPAPRQEFKAADMVVVAHLVSEQRFFDTDGGVRYTLYRLKVTRRMKGAKLTEITVVSQNDSGRFWIDAGQDYLLFVTLLSGHRVVNNCGNSGLLVKSDKVLAEIGVR